ncbi:TonB-dependent siderophore receptor [Pseudothauera nasutitermitis]|uniref:TonB-dependent siderophore receptor n=1 Tax=Pseudothauera nasutitermitis TaxID=2565930 RepID=A0A4V3WAV5_9RHOO|nr:TonB-dependent receptor [Pseudothauera nasutitermitis]THF60776.1 TonB-dependent siderophore receptor [Pseudothauera nasutitermitis]
MTHPPRPQRKPLAMLLHAAFAGSLLLAVPLLTSPLAHAQSAEQRHYEVPAGPLEDALNRFSRQAGITLSFDPTLTHGLNSPGLRGQYDLQGGLDTLTAGQGVRAVQGSSGNWTLMQLPRPAGGDARLAPVTVTAKAERTGITENTGSYTTRNMQTATKLPLSIRETPQAVTVVTRQQMDDQKVEILENVLAATPGISMTKDGPHRVAFYSRGFAVDSLMTDGLPSELSHYISREMNATPDMAIYDRVEIVRGATGMMQGAGNPSAAINMVRKRPTATPQLSVTASAGSWDNYRVEVDAANALNEAGTLRGRVVATYQNKNSFQNVADTERSVLYAIAEADLGKQTLLTAGFSHQNANHTSSWGGLPVAMDGSNLGLSRSTYLGNNWDYWDQDNTTLFTQLEHRFGNDWKLHLSASHTWSDLDMLGSQLERTYWVDARQFGQYVGQYKYTDRQSSYDAFASGPFRLLGRSHELVVGASLRDLDFDGKGNSRSDELDLDIHNWDPGSVAPQAMDLNYWHQDRTTRQKGFYTTARFNVSDTLKFIVGGRYDWFDYDAKTRNGTRTTRSRYAVDRHFTAYAGVIYDLDARHSLYASYTDIFKPQSALNASGKTLKPIVGKNYEIGLKGEYFGGGLNASVALFRIDQENRAKALTRDQCSDLVPSCSEAAGEVRSEGIELELNGRLTPGWQLAAGYTFAEAKYRKDADPAKVGRLFATDLPRHMFKLFTSYQMPGELNRWKIGGGVSWQSDIYNKGTNFYDAGTPFRIEQKAYALANLFVGYRASKNLDVRLNIDNLFDKTYWRAIGSNTAYAVNQYGEPRKFTLTGHYQF